MGKLSSYSKKLIEEIKKPGRECIYDTRNSSHKNNHKKTMVWTEIGNALGVNKNDCQALWKSLRRRYQAALNKHCGRNGSERIEISGSDQFLIKEMNYFQNFFEQKGCKREVTDGAKNASEDPLKPLKSLPARALKTNTEKRDPFFLAMEDEFLKVPEYCKSALKLKLMTIIVENQE